MGIISSEDTVIIIVKKTAIQIMRAHTDLYLGKYLCDIQGLMVVYHQVRFASIRIISSVCKRGFPKSFSNLWLWMLKVTTISQASSCAGVVGWTKDYVTSG